LDKFGANLSKPQSLILGLIIYCALFFTVAVVKFKFKIYAVNLPPASLSAAQKRFKFSDIIKNLFKFNFYCAF